MPCDWNNFGWNGGVDCTPSRGSRYNSGQRYISQTDSSRLAIVVSDDRTVDIIPLLRPQFSRLFIEEQISKIENATLDNYHKPRNWLDKHRFYMGAEQCARINAALDRIEATPLEVGRLVIITERFEPDLLMDESYLL